MSELIGLMRRLQSMEPDQSTAIRMYRMTSPSEVTFENSVVTVEGTTAAAQAIGSYPTPISLLGWVDQAPTRVEADQQIARELGATMTFVADRRIQVASTETAIRVEGSTLATFLPTNVEDTGLIGPVEIDLRADMETFLSSLMGLDSDDLEVIMRAVELHYAAVLLFDTEVNTASTLLVAGVETLASHFEREVVSWKDFWDAERLDSIFQGLELTTTQQETLRQALLEEQHPKLAQRFVSYVLRLLPPGFWEAPVERFVPSLTMAPEHGADFNGYTASAPLEMEALVPSDRDELRRRLNATYGARSRFVHAGTKGHGAFDVLSAAAGSATRVRGKPIPFAGMRRVLRAVIQQQIQASASPASSPGVNVQRARD